MKNSFMQDLNKIFTDNPVCSIVAMLFVSSVISTIFEFLCEFLS